MEVQNASIQELAETLRETLAIANQVPDLMVIPDSTNVIEQIGRQSLRAAALIGEYTKSCKAGIVYFTILSSTNPLTICL